MATGPHRSMLDLVVADLQHPGVDFEHQVGSTGKPSAKRGAVAKPLLDTEDLAYGQVLGGDAAPHRALGVREVTPAGMASYTPTSTTPRDLIQRSTWVRPSTRRWDASATTRPSVGRGESPAGVSWPSSVPPTSWSLPRRAIGGGHPPSPARGAALAPRVKTAGTVTGARWWAVRGGQRWRNRS
jgi:hypothetical protein